MSAPRHASSTRPFPAVAPPAVAPPAVAPPAVAPLAALALVALLTGVTSLSAPASKAHAFTLTGTSLGLDQRDVRIFDNFADPEANDNTVPHHDFPGSVGAALAIRKAHAEWASVAAGGVGVADGLGDNAVLGSGGALFDNTWQGLLPGAPAAGDNAHSADTAAACTGSVVSYVEFDGSGGWRIIYCDQLLWDDGPGHPVDNALDLQGIATREIGFVLGLGHSSAAGNPTMTPFLFGPTTNLRSIEADDIFGVQAIYGVASVSKPVITGLSGSTDVGSLLTLHGSGFASTGNEVWFTSAGVFGTPIKVLGVPATGGGTTLAVTIPIGAEVGDVLVKLPGAGAHTLSNAFGVDIGSAPGLFRSTGPGLGSTTTDLVPQLTADGDLSPGSATGFTLYLRLVRPNSSGILFVGTGEGDLPFKGGLFDPVPILIEVPLGTDAQGGVTLPAAIPPGTPPLTLVLQAWFADPDGPQGATASNGLELSVP